MQGKKLLKKILGSCSLLLLTAPAFADMSLPYGWYLEANAGSTTITGNPYPGRVSASGVGYNGNLGYKFMPYIATEFGYTGYANSTVTNAAGAKAGLGKTYVFDLAAKGILPFYNSGFEAFAKVGAQRIATNMSLRNAAAAAGLGLSASSHSATGLYLGAGVEYYFMPEAAVVAQWARAQGSSATGNASLLTAGIQFIFG